MSSRLIKKIIIAEPSEIIREGLSNILTNREYEIMFVNSLDEISNYKNYYPIDVILVNPVLLQNNTPIFNKISSELTETKWLGIVFSFFEKKVLGPLDDLIDINDNSQIINEKITRLLNLKTTNIRNVISEREIDVLKLLVEGNSNKEIADKLFISTHTVMTHRKNIAQKTGIRSVSGLTIYAVVNKIITLEDYPG